jgi:hypothetical protein
MTAQLNTETNPIVPSQQGGLLVDFALIDLFGGTTDLFESEQEALQAADALLHRYRQQATVNEWRDPEYMSGIMVMRVSHRCKRINNLTAVKGNTTSSHLDYRIQTTQQPAKKTKLIAVKARVQ